MVLAGLSSLIKGPLAQNMLSDLEDQHSWTALIRADAGSWQIADRCTVASSAAHRIAVGDFRVHFVVEL